MLNLPHEEKDRRIAELLKRNVELVTRNVELLTTNGDGGNQR